MYVKRVTDWLDSCGTSTSSNVKEHTDKSLDVCDGWRDRHDLRPDQGSLNSFSQIADRNNMILRHVLESPYPEASNVSLPRRLPG